MKNLLISFVYINIILAFNFSAFAGTDSIIDKDKSIGIFDEKLSNDRIRFKLCSVKLINKNVTCLKVIRILGSEEGYTQKSLEQLSTELYSQYSGSSNYFLGNTFAGAATGAIVGGGIGAAAGAAVALIVIATKVIYVEISGNVPQDDIDYSNFKTVKSTLNRTIISKINSSQIEVLAEKFEEILLNSLT